MVKDLEDTAARHPSFASTETVNGMPCPVTIFSYQRYKFTLYTIAARIISEIYFGSSSKSLVSVARTIRSLSRELEVWFSALPAELKCRTDVENGAAIQDPAVNYTLKIFRLQALALQLAHENIQILLHRPLLQLPLRWRTPQHGVPPTRDGAEGDAEMNEVDDAILAMSKRKCWESAIRTSNLTASIVGEAKYTHAASYVGIHMFTAGTILSIVALSTPLTTESQEAKQAIARIVSTSASMGMKTLLSHQSQQVLKELVRLILEKEMTSIFVEAERPSRQANEAQKADRVAGLDANNVPPDNSALTPNFDRDDTLHSAAQSMMALYGTANGSSRALGSEGEQDHDFRGLWNNPGITNSFDNRQGYSPTHAGTYLGTVLVMKG